MTFKNAIRKISLFFKKTPIVHSIGRCSKFGMSWANLLIQGLRHSTLKQLVNAAVSGASLFQAVFKGLPGKKRTYRINGKKLLKTTSARDWNNWQSFCIGTDPLCGPKTHFWALCPNRIQSRFQTSSGNSNPLLDDGKHF